MNSPNNSKKLPMLSCSSIVVLLVRAKPRIHAKIDNSSPDNESSLSINDDKDKSLNLE